MQLSPALLLGAAADSSVFHARTHTHTHFCHTYLDTLSLATMQLSPALPLGAAAEPDCDMLLVPESLLFVEPSADAAAAADTGVAPGRSGSPVAAAAASGAAPGTLDLPDRVQWLVGYRQGRLALYQWTHCRGVGIGGAGSVYGAEAGHRHRPSLDLHDVASQPATLQALGPYARARTASGGAGVCAGRAGGDGGGGAPHAELLWRLQLGSLPISLCPRGWVADGATLAVGRWVAALPSLVHF